MALNAVKVSILVPVYNVEPWIERCVRSLFKQTYTNLEYVFVDDYTQDKSIDILLGVLNDYPARKDQVVVIHNRYKSGPPICRDIAIKKATGDFVCFVDSDDWLETNAIEILIEEQERTSSDVVWGNALMHTSEAIFPLNEHAYADRHEWLSCYSRLTQGLVMVVWRRLIRRSLFADFNISTEGAGNYAEDKVLMTQIAYFAKSFSSVDSVVYHYNRLNERSLTTQLKNDTFCLDVFRQEMQSLTIIEEFWKARENVYYQEMVKAKLLLLMQRLYSALHSSSYQGFKAVKRQITATDKSYFPIVGLDNKKTRVVFSNYLIAKAYWLYKRI